MAAVVLRYTDGSGEEQVHFRVSPGWRGHPVVRALAMVMLQRPVAGPPAAAPPASRVSRSGIAAQTEVSGGLAGVPARKAGRPRAVPHNHFVEASTTALGLFADVSGRLIGQDGSRLFRAHGSDSGLSGPAEGMTAPGTSRADGPAAAGGSPTTTLARRIVLDPTMARGIYARVGAAALVRGDRVSAHSGGARRRTGGARLDASNDAGSDDCEDSDASDDASSSGSVSVGGHVACAVCGSTLTGGKLRVRVLELDQSAPAPGSPVQCVSCVVRRINSTRPRPATYAAMQDALLKRVSVGPLPSGSPSAPRLVD
jgi:hypothetical protein